MLKRILLALAVAVGGFAAVVASRPPLYRTERAVLLIAPAEIPFALVNDLHRWRLWSPWDALDPNLKRRYDGVIAGPGAVYTWTGNAQAGQGRVTLLNSQPYKSIYLRFERDGRTSTFHFTFQRTSGGVRLLWAQEGPLSPWDRVRSVFSDLDAERGATLERGLAALQTVTNTEVQNRRERDALIKARSEPKPEPPAPAPAP